MPGAAEPTVWPILHYEETERAVRFLVDALGFREALVVRGDNAEIVHAELRWPGGGAVVGSTRHTGGVHGGMPAGASTMYVVADDVDSSHRRAIEASAEVVEPPHDTAFGAGVPTPRVHRPRPRGQPVDVRHVPRRALTFKP